MSESRALQLQRVCQMFSQFHGSSRLIRTDHDWRLLGQAPGCRALVYVRENGDICPFGFFPQLLIALPENWQVSLRTVGSGMGSQHPSPDVKNPL